MVKVGLGDRLESTFASFKDDNIQKSSKLDALLQTEVKTAAE